MNEFDDGRSESDCANRAVAVSVRASIWGLRSEGDRYYGETVTGKIPADGQRNEENAV